MSFYRYVASILLLGSGVGAAAGGGDAIRLSYERHLARQCPAKHLEWLAPAELRDALDTYKQHLRTPIGTAMEGAEARHCATVMAGATCANMGDLEIAGRERLLTSLTAAVCGQFALCREQSDCDLLPIRR